MQSVATTSWTASMRAEKEHGNIEDHFVVTVRDTRANDDKSIVGHRLLLAQSPFLDPYYLHSN